MIDYAEALTVIDVNSGSFVGRGKQARLEDTITRTNLEAAEAVVNELRLRDIGGIIVIDFIDMARARNREAVLKTLRKALDEDRTKTFTAEISKLGLVEMTRQNVTEGVREIMTRACPTCDGDGVVLSEETVAIEFERRMREIGARASRDVEAFLIQMNPRVSGQFTGSGARVLQLLEIETGKHFLFTGSEGLPLDHFDIVMEGSLDDIREEAIPFREGDEVLVSIVEPHMYAVDDAVAKIDGYIVSVAGGGAHVGEKRLVRIVEAGRTAANAVLVDNGAAPAKRGGAGPAKPAKRSSRRTSTTAAAEAGSEPAPAPSPAARRRRPAAAKAVAAEEAADGESRFSRDEHAGESDDESVISASGVVDETGAEDAPAAEEEAATTTPRRRGTRGGTRRRKAATSPEDDEAAASDADAAAADEAPDATADADREDAEGSGEDDAVESNPRRRGRRGGRRRSAAKAETTSAD
jgi:ribonuclease G